MKTKLNTDYSTYDPEELVKLSFAYVIQHYKRSRAGAAILLKNKMKSSVMALILLSMAANVQAECPVEGCGPKKWCTGPGTNGQCKDKKKYGESAVRARECHSMIKIDGKCGCSEQTGDKGCTSNYYCHVSQGKCKLKKGWTELCRYNYECKSNDCHNPLGVLCCNHS